MKILKSQIAGADFDSAVRDYAAEVKAWADHMMMVKAQPDAPDYPHFPDFIQADVRTAVDDFLTAQSEHHQMLLSRFEPHPMPTASPLVMSVVNKDGSIQPFEIEDDSPSANDLLAKKKAELFVAIHEAEEAEIDRVLPAFGKRRLISHRVNEILASDTDRERKLHAEVSGVEAELAPLIEKENALVFKARQTETHKKMDETHRANIKRLNDEAAQERRLVIQEFRSLKANEKLADPDVPVLTYEYAMQPEPDPFTSDDKNTYDDVKAKISELLKKRKSLSLKTCDMAGFHRGERSPEDQRLIDDHTAQHKVMQRISLWIAQMHSDIEDLTSKSIYSWSITPFSEFNAK